MSSLGPYIPPVVTVVDIRMESGFQSTQQQVAPVSQFQFWVDEQNSNSRPIESMSNIEGWGDNSQNHFF